MEKSGWPDDVITEEDKLQFIKEYEEEEGILLDPNEIEKNNGLREIAKLMLNSFWGKVNLLLLEKHYYLFLFFSLVNVRIW